jgi:nitrogen fixation protein FixH
MSHIDWMPSPSDRTPQRGPSRWRFFPAAVAVAMGVVVAVNGGLIFAALHSFPGKVGSEGFALSNHYDAVLDREQRDAALGWTVQARTDETGRPVVTLTDRDGAPLRGAAVTATAERPLGAAATQVLAFREIADGRYLADAVLTAPGQWDLSVSAYAGEHDVAATRRIIVR